MAPLAKPVPPSWLGLRHGELATSWSPDKLKHVLRCPGKLDVLATGEVAPGMPNAPYSALW